MRQITKLETFDIPKECAFCGGDLNGEDPYKITFDDGYVDYACDTCGVNLAELLGLKEAEIKKIEI